LHYLQGSQLYLFKLPCRAVNYSTSQLNGLPSLPTSTEDSSSVPKTISLSLSYFATNPSTLLCHILLLLLFHSSTDLVSQIFLCHWILLIHSWLRRRMPHRLASLPPPRLPYRQAGLPFSFPVTYLLINSYMLRMSFVTLLLGLANRARFVLVANPWMETQSLREPPEPEPDPHDFLPRRTRGVGPPK
jgi:hypothetical protein